MKIEDIPRFFRHPYHEICSCGEEHQILTGCETDDENETVIYLLCSCGQYIEFILPVL